jgi:hypothetical protein
MHDDSSNSETQINDLVEELIFMSEFFRSGKRGDEGHEKVVRKRRKEQNCQNSLKLLIVIDKP